MYREYGVNTDMVKIHREVPTGIGVILIDEMGRNSISNYLGANLRLGKTDIDDVQEYVAGSYMVRFQLESAEDLYPHIDYIKPTRSRRPF